jgi:hypothetical protein
VARHPHLVFDNISTRERYTSTRTNRQEFNLPARNRATHGQKIVAAFEAARDQREQFPKQVGNGFYQSPGLLLTFESEPSFPLAFESLDLTQSKIQLLSVIKDEENRTIATVRVPDDKIPVLLRKLEAYRDFNPDAEKPGRENKKLVESISNIKLATLRELWTDERNLYPPANATITWEVWLRRPEKSEEKSFVLLAAAAQDFGFELVSTALNFIDRTVVLVRGSREQLALGVEVLGIIAEVRKAKVTTDFFAALSPSDQHDWGDELLQRLTAAPAGAPAVGLLDTGVNHAHPLLAPIIADEDVQTLNPAWGAHDSWPNGHGTQMAGLALYGDLTPVLESDQPIILSHTLQSVKLIHHLHPHEERLYGAVTTEGIARLEIDAERKRAYCLAITADARDRGKPTSWSAAVDDLAFGGVDGPRRLIFVSAGNTEFNQRGNYAAYNEVASVQDPAQAWNAVTVGGYTEKSLINAQDNSGWTILADHGDLAPSSTTSVTWPAGAKRPYKPDIVMEAGNMARPPGLGDPDFLDELQMLTTNHQFAAGHRPFSTFHDTSASTALAAGLAARLMARYPGLTPEAVRGLMIHSARWTPAMLARATDAVGQVDMARLLRLFGYGAPSSEALFYSADNALTLIAQETLQPFLKEKSDLKSNDIKFHTLPWPKQALLDLPLDTPVEMRVTLSYFVEPSPGERGWDRKYGYASHGLRFQVKRATETLDAFHLRINAHDRDDEYEEDHAGETGRWELGALGPTNGSVHSNTWHGTAAALAERGHIAVHPTLGWWRTRASEKRFDCKVHYALIVTLGTPDQDVDIYTPIATAIGIDVETIV